MKSLYGVSRENVNKLIKHKFLSDWSDVVEDGVLSDGSQAYTIQFDTSDEQHRAYMLAFCNTLIEEPLNEVYDASVSPKDKEETLNLDEVEMLYLSEYDSDSVEESSGDDVLDFLNWCRMACRKNLTDTPQVGTWKNSPQDNIAICSVCNYEHYLGTYHQYATKYCPNCGMKMEPVN